MCYISGKGLMCESTLTPMELMKSYGCDNKMNFILQTALETPMVEIPTLLPTLVEQHVMSSSPQAPSQRSRAGASPPAPLTPGKGVGTQCSQVLLSMYSIDSSAL